MNNKSSLDSAHFCRCSVGLARNDNLGELEGAADIGC